MQERYRSDYDGEFVILNTEYVDGQKIQHREWIEDPIEVSHISGRAVVIGNGTSRKKFNVKKLENHKGGLLGCLMLQTYGVQGCWKELKTDFYVELDSGELEKVIESGIQENVVVYTSTRNCLKHPGEFYLIPYNTKLQPVAIPIWIAAFDEHKEIFLVGIDAVDDNNVPRHKEVQDVYKVLSTYNKTKFVIVNDSRNVPDLWRSCPNVRLMDYLTFKSYCDI